METTNLKELRELRAQEKAIKARIDEISTAATNEAVAFLAAQGLEKGKFTLKGIGDFVLDKDPILAAWRSSQNLTFRFPESP